ncbi:MAG: energy transducer TonB [Thermodesulfobacteriota bacterium]
MGFRRRADTEDLLKMGAVSLGLHIGLVVFLSLNPWPVVIKAKPMAYTVTLVPIAIPEPETRFKQLPKPEMAKQKEKPITKPKKDDLIEKVKKPQTKVEKPEEKKADLKQLHEALEELRKKIALDELEKKVARRETVEQRPMAPPPPVPVVTVAKRPTEAETKLSQYYSAVWAKIKKAWTIPETLLKERVDLETIIIIIIESDGQIRRMWFEKKSGNDLYDQMAMRAIKKAEPLPPIPKEIGENTLEIGIRFLPD